jgi:ATP-dependent Clp protease ATP-binding subunit ClpB
MRMDKLTTPFQMALAEAQSVAVGRDHQYVEPLHLMQALLDQDGGTARALLQKTDVNAARLRSALGEALDQLPRVEGTAGEILISNDLNRLLNVTDKLDPVIGRDDEIRSGRSHGCSCATCASGSRSAT